MGSLFKVSVMPVVAFLTDPHLRGLFALQRASYSFLLTLPINQFDQDRLIGFFQGLPLALHYLSCLRHPSSGDGKDVARCRQDHLIIVA